MEHIKLAQKCFDYFRLPAFAPKLGDSVLREYVLNGTYSFLDYALVSWPQHLIRAFQDKDDHGVPNDFQDCCKNLTESLRSFLKSRWTEPKCKPRIPKSVVTTVSSVPGLNQDSNSELRKRLLLTLACMHRLTSTWLKDDYSSPTLVLLDTVPTIRAQIEELATENPQDYRIRKYYGESLFKCTKLCCDWYSRGFCTAREREKHVAKHERPYRCRYWNCTWARMGFTNQGDLDKHIEDYHTSNVKDDDFSWPDEESQADTAPQHEGSQMHQMHTASCECQTCKSGQIVYQDLCAETQQDTIDRVESVESTSDADIDTDHVSEGTSAQIEIEPDPNRDDMSENEIIESIDDGDDVQPPQQTAIPFQCRICSKTFTRRFNLNGHLRAHADDRPYACSHCDKTFHRQHDRNTHQRLHSGERNFVCHGVLQSGGEWGCGKSFSMAKTLLRHYRSEKGRRCVQPLRDQEVARMRSSESQSESLAMLATLSELSQPVTG